MARKIFAFFLVVAAVTRFADSAVAQTVLVPSPAPRPTGPDAKHLDFSVATGELLSSDWTDQVLLGSFSGSTGSFEQLLLRDVGLVPGRSVDAAVAYWRGRYGFRVHGAHARSCVATGRDCSAQGSFQSGDPLLGPNAINVDTWLYEVNGMIGLRNYGSGEWAWPYAFFGLGGITYDLEKPLIPTLRTLVRERGSATGQQTIVIDRTSEFLLSIDEVDLESTPAISVGIGTDLRIPLGGAGVGLRIEAADHIARSPIQLRISELGGTRSRFFGPSDQRLIDVGWVHNLRLAAGLVVHFGL